MLVSERYGGGGCFIFFVFSFDLVGRVVLLIYFYRCVIELCIFISKYDRYFTFTSIS